MTTAPVTTGGKIRWITCAPRKWMITPTAARTRPATRIAPVTLAVEPPAARIEVTAPTNEALVPR